jgi:murein DD-endopeptidase MepM/ murein hydrolase activator NlpD
MRNMENKLSNLADWLEDNGLKVESSLVSSILLKLGSGIPEELQGMYSNEELGLSPPESLREIRKLFPPEELGGTSTEILKDKILYERKILKKGPQDDATSELVSEIQSLLKEHGYTLPGYGADGIFGNETEKAIIEFQKNNKNIGLIESGEVDASTLIMLQSQMAARGDRGSGPLKNDLLPDKQPLLSAKLSPSVSAPANSSAGSMAELRYRDPTRGEGEHKYPSDYSPFRATDKRHSSGHKGIDLFAARGTPIFPLGPGKVIKKTTGKKSGKMIIIIDDHGVRSSYMHLDSFGRFDAGDDVGADDIIGYLGDTGNAKGTSPHLHFEVRVGGGLINPKSIFGKKISNASNHGDSFGRIDYLRKFLNKIG